MTNEQLEQLSNRKFTLAELIELARAFDEFVPTADISPKQRSAVLSDFISYVAQMQAVAATKEMLAGAINHDNAPH